MSVGVDCAQPCDWYQRKEVVCDPWSFLADILHRIVTLKLFWLVSFATFALAAKMIFSSSRSCGIFYGPFASSMPV